VYFNDAFLADAGYLLLDWTDFDGFNKCNYSIRAIFTDESGSHDLLIEPEVPEHLKDPECE
jgi:hypothetical protein